MHPATQGNWKRMRPLCSRRWTRVDRCGCTQKVNKCWQVWMHTEGEHVLTGVDAHRRWTRVDRCGCRQKVNKCWHVWMHTEGEQVLTCVDAYRRKTKYFRIKRTCYVFKEEKCINTHLVILWLTSCGTDECPNSLFFENLSLLVCSLVGRFFQYMFIKTYKTLCFLKYQRTIIYVHVNIILDVQITYKNIPCFSNQNEHVYIKQ